jgi:hypothetical protein
LKINLKNWQADFFFPQMIFAQVFSLIDRHDCRITAGLIKQHPSKLVAYGINHM